MPRMSVECDVCFKPVEQPRRGRPRERHPECLAIHDALARLERVVEGELVLGREALIELRWRLIELTSRLPRVRDARGRFVGR